MSSMLAESGLTWAYVLRTSMDGVYRNTVRVAFGESLKLADPVPAVVDSGLFPG